MWLPLVALFGALLGGIGGQDATPQEKQPSPEESGTRIVRKFRSIFFPLRLGGAFLYGLGSSKDPFEESARNGTKLSEENLKFLSEMCDVVALPATVLTPQTYRKMLKPDALFTPLLLLSASTLYEDEKHVGNVGGWRPEMQGWTLRDKQGNEVPHPEKGAHWMDFGNMQWADHWRARTQNLVGYYGAFGAVAMELPLGNTAVGEDLQAYPTRSERAEATLSWLRRVRGNYLMVPSALGFDEVVQHSVSPVEEKFRELELAGRYWDYFQPWIDGVWAEGWLQPYWAEVSLPIALREIHMAAANRAAKNGQVFIVNAAYRNDAELETLAAHFLLTNYVQSSMVFQPMPVSPSSRPDAGLSLALYKQQIEEKAHILQVPLGTPQEERIRVRCINGYAWRRRYQLGVVYMNPADNYSITISLGSPLLRVNGATSSLLELAPRSAVILLYPPTRKLMPEASIRNLQLKQRGLAILACAALISKVGSALAGGH